MEIMDWGLFPPVEEYIGKRKSERIFKKLKKY